MRGLRNVVAMNLPEPSGSSPEEKPPGKAMICALLTAARISLMESSMACGLRLRMTTGVTTAPARSKARCVSYSQFVPGKTGMKTRGFANVVSVVLRLPPFV